MASTAEDANMFSKFTERARMVIVVSVEEARLLGHDYVGTEHLLLGLIREGDGVAAQLLIKRGADLDSVRRQIGMAGEEPPAVDQ